MITKLLQEIWCSRRSILDKLWDVSSSVSTCKSKQRLLRAQNRVSSHWRYLNPPQKSFIMQSKCPLFCKVQHFCSEIWKSGGLQFIIEHQNLYHFQWQMFDVKIFINLESLSKKYAYLKRQFFNNYQNNCQKFFFNRF